MDPSLFPVGRSEPNWRLLFPEINEWIESAPAQDLDGSSLAFAMARADAALALADFFWPSFVIVDDMVLRAYIGDSSILDAVNLWMKSTNGDRMATERILNHEHFWHLLQSSLPTEDCAMQLGALVREMWAAKLSRDFPNRQFEVALHSGPEVELMDHQITFWQKR